MSCTIELAIQSCNTCQRIAFLTAVDCICPEHLGSNARSLQKNLGLAANKVNFKMRRIVVRRDKDTFTVIFRDVIITYVLTRAFGRFISDINVTFFWKYFFLIRSYPIVMIYFLQLKCHKYWPDETQDYGDISVMLVKQEHYSDYIIRTFNLKRVSCCCRC